MNAIAKLTNSVNLCNNGYLLYPSFAEKEVAATNSNIFGIMGNGAIYLKVNANRMNRAVPKAQMKETASTFDFEGAILARQEKFINY